MKKLKELKKTVSYQRPPINYDRPQHDRSAENLKKIADKVQPKQGAPIWAIKWPIPKGGYRKITKESVIGTGSLKFNKIANTKSVTYNSFGKILKPAPPFKKVQEEAVHFNSVADVAADHGYKFSHNDRGGSYHYIHPSGARVVEVDDPNGRWHHYPDYKKSGHQTTGFEGTNLHKHLSKHHGVSESALLEFQKDGLVTIHYGAHAHEPHRVTMLHPDKKVTILPTKPRGRENRYPQGELKVSQQDLHPFDHQITELHDEPDRPGVGIGSSNREGMNMTEEPRKTLKISKADWEHHTKHATAQYDHEGKPWVVQKDASGAAVRIPVQITEDYPYRKTLRAVLQEAFPPKPEDNTGTEKPVSKTAKMVKDTVKKDKAEKSSSNDAVTIGKTKDKFEAEPVLTPVLSIANMPGGAVR